MVPEEVLGVVQERVVAVSRDEGILWKRRGVRLHVCERSPVDATGTPRGTAMRRGRGFGRGGSTDGEERRGETENGQLRRMRVWVEVWTDGNCRFSRQVKSANAWGQSPALLFFAAFFQLCKFGGTGPFLSAF